MKKLLSISVIAALAALPMAANATVGDVVASSVEPAHADPATVATAAPGYALVTEGANDGNLATAGYVKGAYNASMKAINKVATTAGNAADKNLSNISTAGEDVIKGLAAAGAYDNTDSELTATTIQDAIDEVAGTAGSAVQSVVEGSTNGTVSVDGTDVAVHGLGTAAYTAASDYATAAQGAKADTALQAADLANYATHDGVENTIETATYTVSVPTLTAWGNDSSVGTAANVTVTAAATYAEPTPEPEEPEEP